MVPSVSGHCGPSINRPSRICGQCAQCVGGTVDQRCRVGILDDVGQGPVEVEEHRRSSRRYELLELAVNLQGIGDGRRGGVTGAHRDFSEVGDHSVGAAGQQAFSTSVTVETNDEAETSVPAGSYTGLIVRDDHAATGANSQLGCSSGQGRDTALIADIDDIYADVSQPSRQRDSRIDDTSVGLLRNRAAQVDDHRIVVTPVYSDGSFGHPCDDVTVSVPIKGLISMWLGTKAS